MVKVAALPCFIHGCSDPTPGRSGQDPRPPPPPGRANSDSLPDKPTIGVSGQSAVRRSVVSSDFDFYLHGSNLTCIFEGMTGAAAMNEEEVYCVCSKPNDGRFMIACDSCENWFHGKCVGQFKTKSSKWTWHCPNCCNSWNGRWQKIPTLKTSQASSPSKVRGTNCKQTDSSAVATTYPDLFPSCQGSTLQETASSPKVQSFITSQSVGAQTANSSAAATSVCRNIFQTSSKGPSLESFGKDLKTSLNGQIKKEASPWKALLASPFKGKLSESKTEYESNKAPDSVQNWKQTSSAESCVLEQIPSLPASSMKLSRVNDTAECTLNDQSPSKWIVSTDAVQAPSSSQTSQEVLSPVQSAVYFSQGPQRTSNKTLGNFCVNLKDKFVKVVSPSKGNKLSVSKSEYGSNISSDAVQKWKQTSSSESCVLEQIPSLPTSGMTLCRANATAECTLHDNYSPSKWTVSTSADTVPSSSQTTQEVSSPVKRAVSFSERPFLESSSKTLKTSRLSLKGKNKKFPYPRGALLSSPSKGKLSELEKEYGSNKGSDNLKKWKQTSSSAESCVLDQIASLPTSGMKLSRVNATTELCSLNDKSPLKWTVSTSTDAVQAPSPSQTTQDTSTAVKRVVSFSEGPFHESSYKTLKSSKLCLEGKIKKAASPRNAFKGKRSAPEPAQQPDESDELDEEIFVVKKKKITKRTKPPKPEPRSDDCSSSIVVPPSEKKKISCRFCNLKFSSYSSVSRHRLICQENPNRSEANKCNVCSRTFSRKYMYQAHIKGGCKATIKDGSKLAKNIQCPIPGCSMDFVFKNSVYKHLIHFHKRSDLKDASTYKFSSFEEFLKWKTKVEDKTFSYYSQQFGKRDGKYYYYCQKDGKNRCHDKVQRKTDRRNYKGSVKKDQLCLSMMAVTCSSDGKVSCLFYPSHSHKCLARDLKFQPLSSETNEYIRRQLAWSVPPRKIVENLRDDSYKRDNRGKKRTLKRDNLIKVKTIAERKRKNKSKLRYANDDAASVYMKAQVLMNESFNPLLIYKPQGEKLVFGPSGAENLPEDIFMFGIQSQEQLEMMKKHSRVILVVDETHGTNQCGFKLLNLVVRDDFNLGYPVGHLITSRSDEAFLQYFFKAIKDRCPDITINCCITDDDPTLINSLRAGFGEEIWHILCIWHIHRTVQCKLKEHIKNTQLVDEMYQIICLMIDVKTEEEFKKLVQSFLCEFGQVSPAYKKYFETTFLPKAKKWAMCYRKAPHGAVETTMLVESFHNILKSIYLKRIPNRRIDDLIDLLLQVEEDYFVRYDNAIQLETLWPRDIKKIKERHLRGAKIDDQDVFKVSSTCYEVKSQEKDTCEKYKVVRCIEKCDNNPCLYICPTCAICSHMYQCTCPDTTPLCKHIHKVHLMDYIPSASSNDPLIDQEPEFFVGENIEESLEATESVVQNPDFTIEKKLERIKDIMKEVENDLDNSPVKKFMLSRIQSVLSDLHYQCKALTDDNTREKPVPEMDKQINIYPNEKMKRQVKPFKRVKKTKKKKGLQRPNKKSAEEIKRFLFQDDVNDDNAENVIDESPVILDGGENNQQMRCDEFNTGENDLLELNDETVINEFFKVLATNEALHLCNTSDALLFCEGSVIKALGNSHSKNTILVPVRLAESELSVAAICVKSQELWYFNPLAKPHSSLSRLETKFLSSLAACARSIFPAAKRWTIQRHFDPQEDSVNCAVMVCWFGYQISDMGKGPVPELPDVAACRKEIYDAIGL